MSKFAGTEQVCARLGWEYWLVGGRGPVLAAHLRSLACRRLPPSAPRGCGDRVEFVADEHVVVVTLGPGPDEDADLAGVIGPA